MRPWQLKLGLLIVAATLPGSSLSARGTWNITAPKKSDSRWMKQLQELARQEHATIRFSTSGKPSRGSLSVEFREVESADKFLETLKQLGGDRAKNVTRELAEEGYTLTADYDKDADPAHIAITSASARGFHNALLRFPQTLHLKAGQSSKALAPPPQSLAEKQNGRGFQIVMADFPSFPERGIVEGFYGKPWSHRDRLDMLRFEGQHAMNVYYYAPKDDPYHRALWRKPYPATRMKQLGELVGAARANFVDFCFAISPGLSMTYSSATDFGDLTNKLDGISKLGVSCFALFLDDVPQQLQSVQDQSRYKTLAEAHVDLINKLYQHLKLRSAENRLVVTPTTYTNEWGSRDYIRELGAGVNPDVPIVWTGTHVVSPTITVAQAREWGEMLHRKPLVWDNFPVNDGIPWRVNLGPLRGRDPDLPLAVRGLFSNPMVQPHASKIPLQTVAEYLWNPQAYDPEAAHRRAVTEQYGSDAMKLLAPFLANYSDYWWDDNAFKPLWVEERKTIDVRWIKDRLAQLESAARALRKKPRYQALMAEIAPLLPTNAKRITEVQDSPSYRLQPDGKLAWRDDYLVLYAPRVSTPPALDGDFAKWQPGPLYVLDQENQIAVGHKLWRRAGEFSARFALGWDDRYLYIGADVTDRNLFQPFTGRNIIRGDAVSLVLETAYHKNFQSTIATGDEYLLLLSPGNFADVPPDVYSSEDYLPLRAVPHNYNQEIKTAWKKTPNGYSGDIAIPVAWFEGSRFQAGYEIGLTLGAQKAVPRNPANINPMEEMPRVLLRSKTDRVFPVHIGNPSSYQRLVLIDAGSK